MKLNIYKAKPSYIKKSLITPEQVVGLIKLAGFHIGIGGWTPQHHGNYGMFTII